MALSRFLAVKVALFHGKEKSLSSIYWKPMLGFGSGLDQNSMGSLGPDPDPGGNKRPPTTKISESELISFLEVLNFLL
jgi:hypothetical protein